MMEGYLKVRFRHIGGSGLFAVSVKMRVGDFLALRPDMRLMLRNEPSRPGKLWEIAGIDVALDITGEIGSLGQVDVIMREID